MTARHSPTPTCSACGRSWNAINRNNGAHGEEAPGLTCRYDGTTYAEFIDGPAVARAHNANRRRF